MTFSSLVFIFIFLPIVFVLYYLCKNQNFRNILLIAASLLFYAFGEPVAVIIMIISIIINYYLGIMCESKKFKKISVILAVILNIGMLIGFKYLGFFAETINMLLHTNIPVPQIRLPIGISFFTFQGLSYVIDVYRDKELVQKKLMPVFLYISFFPQLIAGPIVKYHDIQKQLDNREMKLDDVYSGIQRFILGLSKKVLIANQMGYVADLTFNSEITKLSSLFAILGGFCYMFQIYFDFSGYSDMAIGLGRMFGFEFKENFNYPYISDSMQEFWHRWHISLSTWFKEYVYIPLGGNRKGNKRTYLNKMIVFFLTGFWHGANFTFILWGLLHGIMLLLEAANIIPVKKKWFGYIKHIYVIIVVMLTFVIFRADSITLAFAYIGRIFSFSKGDILVNAAIYENISALTFASLVMAVLFSTPILPKMKEKISTNKIAVTIIGDTVTLLLFLLCIIMLISSQYNPFIYFRF